MSRAVSLKIKRLFIPVLFLLFIFSRIYYINAGAVFFDSPEYLHLFSLPSLKEALATGHTPIHIGYIILAWPVYQLATYFHQNGAGAVIVIQILLSVITLYCLYYLISYISDKKVALLATIITAILPLYWIITDTIMMENAYICYFFISIYFLINYINSKKGYFSLFLSLFFFILSIITHTMLIAWLPFLWYLVFYKNRKRLLIYVISSIISAFLAYILNIFITVSVTGLSWTTLISWFANERTDIAALHFDLRSLLIVIRDFFIIQMRNYTSVLTIVGLFAFIKLFKENKHLSILCILWIAPAIYINIWWDALFPGRYAALTGFGLAFTTAYLIRNNKVAISALLVYLLIVTLPAINLLRVPVPYLAEANYAKTLPKNSLLIENHFSRPQVQDTFKGELAAVNDYSWPNGKITDAINLQLKNHKPVFIASSALSDPYGLYIGPYLHPLSLSYTNNFQLNPLITNYKLKEYKTINKSDNLIIYQIVSPGKSQYPAVPNLQRNYRRLDYNDPLTRLWWVTEDLFNTGIKK